MLIQSLCNLNRIYTSDNLITFDEFKKNNTGFTKFVCHAKIVEDALEMIEWFSECSCVERSTIHYIIECYQENSANVLAIIMKYAGSVHYNSTRNYTRNCHCRLICTPNYSEVKYTLKLRHNCSEIAPPGFRNIKF